eukprot:gb/GEZN01008621.1/.p1 GENE.gb/GEZN01008621.1/~~gb/GEZN01008621.1/.p1  ORF type:complete len:282 (+),score=59.65 gb/GEZN01008621.1/:61-906(+)
MDGMEKRKILPSRSTRGNRKTDMHKAGDDDFWSQDFFQDNNADDDYSVSEQEDEFDSDFFDSEEESEEEEVVVQKEKVKKKNMYREPVHTRRNLPEEDTPTPKARASKKEAPSDPVVWEPRQVRERTRHLTKITKEESHRQSLYKKPARRMKELKVWTQEMLLEEAKQTEAENMASLQELLKVEEENKRASRTKAPSSGPRILFHSKAGVNTVTFTGVTQFPTYLHQEPAPYPSPVLCKVMGKPAKYLDPKTRGGFSDIPTFVRARNQAYNPSRKKSNDVS